MRKMIGRARKALAARPVLGSRRGGILMEYVVLAVLLVTAVVVAVIYFGRTISSGMQAATYATDGRPVDATKEITDTQRQNTDTMKTERDTHEKTVAVAPTD